MELYVDIADIKAARAVNGYFPIDGFTTNLNILIKTNEPLSVLYNTNSLQRQ